MSLLTPSFSRKHIQTHTLKQNIISIHRSATKQYKPKSNGASAHGQGMIATGAHTIGITEQSPSTKMKSILEMDNLSDFLIQAQLANKDFVSEREQFLNIDNVAEEYVPTGRATGAIIHSEDTARHNRGGEGSGDNDDKFSFCELSVPRRPQWIPGVTTPEELDRMENESFLNWRRGVARREEEIAMLAFASSSQQQNGIMNNNGNNGSNVSVTPYEKNIHVWRQLWRVLERSSIVLQIVDARNPLFYISNDLRSYAQDELNKPMLILVNKSDYLTEKQRKVWSEYFLKKGYDHLFFSAYVEQKKIDAEASAAKKGEAVTVNDDEKAVVSDNEEEEDAASDNMVSNNSATQVVGQDSLGIATPLTREQLLDALDTFAKRHGCSPDEKYDNRIQYGLVGFPNGKCVVSSSLE